MNLFVACVFGVHYFGFNLTDELKGAILDVAHVATFHREIVMMVGGLDNPLAAMKLSSE